MTRLLALVLVAMVAALATAVPAPAEAHTMSCKEAASKPAAKYGRALYCRRGSNGHRMHVFYRNYRCYVGNFHTILPWLKAYSVQCKRR